MKIKTTEAIARWNEAIEGADYDLGLAADDITEPRKLITLLSLSGFSKRRQQLLAAGVPLGYWAPDGGPACPNAKDAPAAAAGTPGDCPAEPPGAQTGGQMKPRFTASVGFIAVKDGKVYTQVGDHSGKWFLMPMENEWSLPFLQEVLEKLNK